MPTPSPNPVPTPIPPVPITQTTIALQSEAGDWIGQGKTYSYNRQNAIINVSHEKNRLVVEMEGDEYWTGVFQTGGTDTQLKVGTYSNVNRFVDGQDWSKSGLTWWGEGRGCSSSIGTITIDEVKYSGTVLAQISLRFERYCNGASAVLRGEIKYSVDDRSAPPEPVNPAPAILWRPPADLSNSVGNYAYFESEQGEYVGLAKSYRYDQRNATINVSGNAINAVISVDGKELWSAEWRGLKDMVDFKPGYYPSVKGSRFNNPTRGGLSWTADGRGCAKSTGWFVIDAISVKDNEIVALDMRFEQHCEGRHEALRGAVHWTKRADFPPLAGNSMAGSWRAPAGSVPASGNYYFVQSDPGEPLGKGLTELQTASDALIDASVDGNVLSFKSNGARRWAASFSLPVMPVAGTYANLAGGKMSFSLGHYGFFEATGWLVIDSIQIVNGKLVAVELRFEGLGTNRNGNVGGLMHGQLHWRADLPSNFPGPDSVPPLFWRPSAGSTPTNGNYVHLESDRSDFVGEGGRYLYTSRDALFTMKTTGAGLDFDVAGDERWSVTFAPMATHGQIQTGYYGGARRAAYQNTTRGSFSFGGEGRSCNESTSGVVVDKVTYLNGILTELWMRFEQHCENEPGAMRGEIRWANNDNQVPAGPAAVPANLWRAPVGSVPASGNFLYLQSETGDPIGQGKTMLVSTDGRYAVDSVNPRNSDAYVNFNVYESASGRWNASFQSMIGLNRLQVGFYDHTMRQPFHNRAFGGLALSGNGVACNTSIGWFAIDKAIYSGATLVALHARFEQRCDDSISVLRGELNWEAPAQIQMALRKRQPAKPPGQLEES